MWVCFLSLSWCLRILNAHKIPIRSVFEWQRSCYIYVSGIGGAGRKQGSSLKNTFMVIVNWDAVLAFTGSATKFPSFVDLFTLRRSLSLKNITTFKTYLDHHVFFINEVHPISKRNHLLEIITSMWCEVDFQAQNGKNSKVCRFLKRIHVWIVVVHISMYKGKMFTFNKGWVLISDRRQVFERNFTRGWVSW